MRARRLASRRNDICESNNVTAETESSSAYPMAVTLRLELIALSADKKFFNNSDYRHLEMLLYLQDTLNNTVRLVIYSNRNAVGSNEIKA